MADVASPPTSSSTAAVNPNALTPELHNGLIPLSIFALLSALSTFTLLSWITFRLVFKSDYQAFVGYNQYVILIFNLLIADFQQSISFLFTLQWLRIGQIESPSAACFAQAWLLNMGDVSSGMFVLAIAAHTWYSVVLGRKLPYMVFTTGILGIWAFAFLLTVLGPATKGPSFFARTNAWCWINTEYDLYRLWFHYLWVFIVEFGTIIIYAHIFFHLRKRLRSIRSFHPRSAMHRRSSSNRLSQAARYMILYPIIYIILTLPLAAGRMAAMAGRTLPITYYCVAGSLLTSCGWLDTLLYTLTRRVFIKPEATSNRPRTGSNASGGYGKGSRSDSNGARRGWHGRKGSKSGGASPPPPVPADPNWPLSTFASTTVECLGKESYGHGSSSSHAASKQRGNYSHPISGRLTPPDASFLQPPTPDPNHPSSNSGRHTPVLVATETTIQANIIPKAPGSSGSQRVRASTESDEQALIGNGIRSETRIEVVSVSRDEMTKQLERY